jgi:hypothetical protein
LHLEAVLQRSGKAFAMNASPPDLLAHSLDGAIDFSRRFMPDELTAFYHTSGWGALTDFQRLRYNQQSALYFNEQTMFFERALARNVLGYFLGRSLPEELQTGLRQFLVEEERHSAMFRELNRKCAPSVYATQDFYFIRMPHAAGKALDFVSKRPTWFPLLLWLMHLQEERALFFGRTFQKSADFLEAHFVAAQRKHLADEIGHVRWDEALLDWIWPRTGLLLRRFNVRVFAWMIGEYFSTPKRAAFRVMAALAREFPELEPQCPEFYRQLLGLGNDANYRRALYSSENVPNTFRRFDAWPEFRLISGAMPGYIPGVAA